MSDDKIRATQWQPGQSGNPKGRERGSRNKLGEQFVLDLYADWKEHGPAVIEKVRMEQPAQYLKVVAGILPRELHFKSANAFHGMTDEQIDEIVAGIGR